MKDSFVVQDLPFFIRDQAININIDLSDGDKVSESPFPSEGYNKWKGDLIEALMYFGFASDIHEARDFKRKALFRRADLYLIPLKGKRSISLWIHCKDATKLL